MPFRSQPIDGDSAPTGVILAIDYGQRRLGLALSDEHGLTSMPFATWTRINRRRDLARLRDLVRQKGVRKVVVGLPLHLNGSPSEMSEEARGFANRVARALGLPVELMDERLSSWEARQTMGLPSSTRRSRAQAESAAGRNSPPIDDVAASIILRDYLHRAHSQSGTSE
jgi:putative Holliday junction resolvase